MMDIRDLKADEDTCPYCGEDYCRCDVCPECDGTGTLDLGEYGVDEVQACPGCGGRGSY